MTIPTQIRYPLAQTSHRSAKPRKARKHRRWLNRLPEWIGDAPEYALLKANLRRTLEVIAHRCDRPNESGDLLDCLGGSDLMNEIGVSASTFWRHANQLESLGFIVTVNRGGG